MSREYYLVCHECKKKVHVGCVGFSGLQFWSGDKEVMAAVYALLEDCFLHLDSLAFVWEQTKEDDEYMEIEA